MQPNTQQETIHDDAAVVRDLTDNIQSPEDVETLRAWHVEARKGREEAMGPNIGHNALVAIGGATATPEEVQRMREAGQDMSSGSYSNGRRA